MEKKLENQTERTKSLESLLKMSKSDMSQSNSKVSLLLL